MRRREFVALAGASVAWPFAALAQEPGRMYRVGGVSSSPRDAPHFVAMFDELRRAGFVAGQNLTIDWFSYGASTDLIPEFAAELAKKRPDVLVTNGDASIRARTASDGGHSDPRHYPGYGWAGVRDLVGPAQRQYNRCQRLRA
jgi:hypothetical protein